MFCYVCFEDLSEVEFKSYVLIDIEFGVWWLLVVCSKIIKGIKNKK